jgi:WD40 repeat protein
MIRTGTLLSLSQKLLATFLGDRDRDPISSAVFSPNDRHVLIASANSTVQLWETDSGKLLALFKAMAAGFIMRYLF